MSGFSKISINPDNYREVRGVHFSALSRLNRGVNYYLHPPKLNSSAVDLGQLVDCLLTTPELFKDKFTVKESEAEPTGSRKKFIDEVLKFIPMVFRDVDGFITYLQSDETVSIVESQLDTIFKSIYKQGTAREKCLELFTAHIVYCTNSFQNDGTTYITPEMHTQAKNLVMSIKKSAFWSETIKENQKGIEVLFQFDMYSTISIESIFVEMFESYPTIFDREEYRERLQEILDYSDFSSFKGLADIIQIDHIEQTIQPIDLKVTEYAMNFNTAIRKNRYDMQAALYTDLLRSHFQNSLLAEGYELLPFIFLTVHPSGSVLPWYMSQQDIKVGKEGINNGPRKIKGYWELYKELLCYEIVGYDYPLNYHINGKRMITNAYEDLYTD